jgi:hypothetical protein
MSCRVWRWRTTMPSEKSFVINFSEVQFGYGCLMHSLTVGDPHLMLAAPTVC